MSQPHDLPVLYRGPDGALAGSHFDPSPAEALPQQTFAASYNFQANRETLALQHVRSIHPTPPIDAADRRSSARFHIVFA
jgi:hypothetical protein